MDELYVSLSERLREW